MIKISDGDPMHRAGYAVALKLLERFKLVDDLAELKLKFGERHILNAAKKVTGEIKVLC
jgi:L-asparaginase II